MSSKLSDLERLIQEHHIGKLSYKGMHIFQWVLIVLTFALVASGSFYYYSNFDYFSSLKNSNPSFSIDNTFVKLAVLPGQKASTAIEIENTEGVERSFTVKAGNYIFIEDQSFVLKPNQKKIIRIDMVDSDALQHPGLMVDSLHVSNSISTVSVPVAIEIMNSENFRLDLISENTASERSGVLDERLQVRLFGIPQTTQTEVPVSIELFNAQGKQIQQSTFTVVLPQDTLFESIPIQTLTKGTYAVAARSSINNVVAVSSYSFIISDSKNASFFDIYSELSSLKYFTIFALILVLFLLAGYIYLYLFFSTHIFHLIASREQIEKHLGMVQRPKKDDEDGGGEVSEKVDKKVVKKYHAMISKGNMFLEKGKLVKAERIYDTLMSNYAILTYSQKEKLYEDINRFYKKVSKEIEKKHSIEAKEGKKELKKHQKVAKEHQKKEKEKEERLKDSKNEKGTDVPIKAKKTFFSFFSPSDDDDEEEKEEVVEDDKVLAEELETLDKEISRAEPEQEASLETKEEKAALKKKKGKKKYEEKKASTLEAQEDTDEEFEGFEQESSEMQKKLLYKGKSKKFVKCHKECSNSLKLLEQGKEKSARQSYKKALALYLDLDYNEKKDVYDDLTELYQMVSRK